MMAFDTWAALSATTATANQAASVYRDNGTHTDPVVGGTVLNRGVFAYSTSPAGWKRISDLPGANLGMVSLFDYLTPAQIANVQNDVVANLTVEATAAFAAAKRVILPPGTYGFDNLRISNGASFIGSGTSVTNIHQMSATNPAVNCLSDSSTGHILGVEVSGFRVFGHPNATTAAVFVGAHANWTIWNGKFDFFAKDTWRALEVEGDDAANVYNCDFRVTSEGTKSTAVNIHGGVYNRFWLFLTQCKSYAIVHSGFQDHVRCVSENCHRYTGQMNDIWPIIESIKGQINANPAADVGIFDQGFNNTYHTPTVNLLARDAGTLTFAFRPFVGTTYVDPQIVGEGAVSPLYPFAGTYGPFTVLGGRGSAAKIESYYSDPVGVDDRQFSLVNLVGQNEGLSDRVLPQGTMSISPAGGLAVALPSTCKLLDVKPLVNPLPVLQLGTVGDASPVSGRELIVTTTGAISVLQYESELGDCSGLPTSLPAGGVLHAIYSKSSGKWFAL